MAVVVDLPTPFGTVRVKLECLALNQDFANGSAALTAVGSLPPVTTATVGGNGSATAAPSTAPKRPLPDQASDSTPPAKVASRMCVHCNESFRPLQSFYIYCSWGCRVAHEALLNQAKQAGIPTPLPTSQPEQPPSGFLPM